MIGRIFDPFFTTKAAGAGTGIGPSISVAYLAEMGGTLSVQNASGGAVFDIRLPAAVDAAPRTAPLVSSPGARTNQVPARMCRI
jgi:two-component system C4-dicarboxylate transport sensor histidine kinase DctB